MVELLDECADNLEYGVSCWFGPCQVHGGRLQYLVATVGYEAVKRRKLSCDWITSN